MGTNFYTTVNICEICHRSDKLHLGKASIGWKFTLQANGFKYYKNWIEMKKWLSGKKIFDDYGDHIPLEIFFDWVKSRQHLKDPESVNYGDKMHIISGYKFYDCTFS